MRAFRFGFALGAAMLAGLGVASAQQQVVRVGYLLLNPPTQFSDPVTHLPTGAAVELMTAVAKDAGFSVEWHVMNVGDFILALNANIIDGVVGVQFAQALKDQGEQFSDAIWNNSEALIVQKTDAKAYKTLDDLKGEVVGTVLGGPYEDLLKKSGIFKEVKTYTGSALLYQAIIKGDVKAGFGNGIGTKENMRQNNYPELANLRLPSSYQPSFPALSGFGASKNSGDLLKKINASLAKLKADGTVRTIFAKYGIDSNLVK